jgi:hypothetical protein
VLCTVACTPTVAASRNIWWLSPTSLRISRTPSTTKKLPPSLFLRSRPCKPSTTIWVCLGLTNHRQQVRTRDLVQQSSSMRVQPPQGFSLSNLLGSGVTKQSLLALHIHSNLSRSTALLPLLTTSRRPHSRRSRKRTLTSGSRWIATPKASQFPSAAKR